MKLFKLLFCSFTILLATSLFGASFNLSFKNTCAGTNTDNEIILHNIDYNNVKVWGKFKFDMQTFSFKLVDAGLENQTTPSEGDIKEVKLDTTGDNREHGMFVFSSGSYTTDWDNFDIGLEPWCQDEVAMCGNYVDLGEKSLSDISTSDIPSTGLNNTPSNYCNNMAMNHVYINKNHDGTYTAFKIISHEKIGDWNSWCDHEATIQYKNLK